jgi:glyoxylate/hydroxypyruvate reductase A
MGPDSLQNPVGKCRRSLLGSLTKQRRSGKNKSAKKMLPKLLFQGVGLPGWGVLTKKDWAACGFEAVIANREEYDPADISYFCSFRPTPGLIKSLPNLRVIFSMGAGVDGFLRDPELPRHLPLVRFVDPTLIHEMAQYVVMHILMVHRGQRFFDSAQREGQWRQRMLERASRDTRIGMLGLGDIGTAIAQSLLPFDFQLTGWSRTRKAVPGVKSFAGEGELPQFLAQCDYCVCVLPLTKDTQGVLNAKLFAALPKGAWVINVARGGHLVAEDLIVALDSGHLAGAVLDVFQPEPLVADSVLWRHPKITITPHVAALTDLKAAMAFLKEGVRRAESGEPLLHLVDLERGY